MLQFMGRENSEDYGADFSVMLETWQAAVKYLGVKKPDSDAACPAGSTQPIEIARFLGWTRRRKDNQKRADRGS